ncbi:MAG: chromosomal replication initiator protein DnaA [Gemmatimonadaceae bacterium]
MWSRLLDRARRELPAQTYRSWLEPTEAIALEGHTLVIGVPDTFAAEWNEDKHSHLLAGYGPIVLGHPIRIQFRVAESQKARPQMDFFVAPLPKQVDDTLNRAARLVQLNGRYTFANFVIGKSNELAAAAAHAISAAPGKTYNPLFIYGSTGLGKTHLMQAVAHEVLETRPETRVCYVGTEQFTNDLVGSIRGQSMPEFRRRYREIDLLLVDDVHFLKGKEATQEEFFHTFNALYEAGRQIVLTSDRSPAEIPGLEARLVSRFEWGMVADIEAPDFEHRIAILQNKSRLDHLEATIPDDVMRFIAEHVRSNVRELEGTINRLLAIASLRREEVTLELARQALRDKLRGQLHENQHQIAALNPATIQTAVAREWGVTVDALRSKSRTKDIAVPRQVAMYLIRNLLGTQLVEIGSAFGGRDHSTVMYSLEKVEEFLTVNPDFHNRVHQLRSNLQTLRV